jgi:tripartite-type tricarboxylate transporter receptor subunit TctC
MARRTLQRRAFLSLAVGIMGVPGAMRATSALDYPTRPIRFLVGQAAGSGSDIYARLIGQWLSDHFHQPVVVENRAGATGNIAAEVVARAETDGYTLLFVNNSNTINATLYEHLDFKFDRDFAPVAGLLSVPLIMEVNPAVPARTVAEFIAYAKANPGKINMASAGTGSTSHLCGELFMYLTGTKLLHVPYRGTSPALADLMAGQVQVMFDVIASSQQYVAAGKLRALAVTTATRSDVLPDIPPMADVVAGYDATAWGGICAPAGISDDIVTMLNTTANVCLDDRRMKSRLAELGAIAMPGSPADFAAFLRKDIERWADVIKFSGVKLD